MNMDKKTLSAIVVAFLFIMGYNYYLQNKYPHANDDTKTEETAATPAPNAPKSDGVTSQADKPASTMTASTIAVNQLSDADLTFENPQRVLKFDQNKAGISTILLKEYAAHKGDKEFINLLDGEMTLQGIVAPTDRAVRSGYSGKREGNTIAFTRTEGPWEITQTYTIPNEGYGVTVNVSFKNASDKDIELNGSALLKQDVVIPTSGGSFLSPSSPADVGVLYGLEGKRHDTLLKKVCEKDAEAPVNLKNEKLDYVGIDKHYFLGLIWAKDQTADYLVERASDSSDTHCEIATVVGQKFGLVPPGTAVNLKLTGYFGPKKGDVLEAFDPNIRSAVKYGFFSVIARPLLLALKSVHGLVGNWGLAIIIVTILLKVAFFPLTRNAAISAKRMQKLQPQMNALREKFKDDPARQQRELMAFMSQNKVNPFKGCLPILPQIPVFIAFYNVLSQAIELRHAEFYGWLTDLSAKDPYYITPVLLGVGMLIQQKLTPNPGMDKNQEKIMLLMPVIFSFMGLSLPAGMVIYMLTNTIISIAQQRWLNSRIKVETV